MSCHFRDPAVVQDQHPRHDRREFALEGQLRAKVQQLHEVWSLQIWHSVTTCVRARGHRASPWGDDVADPQGCASGPRGIADDPCKAFRDYAKDYVSPIARRYSSGSGVVVWIIDSAGVRDRLPCYRAALGSRTSKQNQCQSGRSPDAGQAADLH
jgi:hypothetical protein